MESHPDDRRGGGGQAEGRLSPPFLRRPGLRSLTLLAVFALVTVSVELTWWTEIDRSVRAWTTSAREPVLWNASKVVFDLVTPEVALPITLGLALFVAWRRRRWSVAGEATIRLGLVVLSVLALKPLLATPGPTRSALGDHGGAFPSGHTTSVLVCVAVLLAVIEWPRRLTSRMAVAVATAVVVGASAIYVDYHYVSDVVGGVLLGLLIATVPVPAFRRPGDARRWGRGLSEQRSRRPTISRRPARDLRRA